MNKIGLKKLIIYFFATIWGIMTLYPLIFTILSSFKNNDEIFSAASSVFQLPKNISWDNYIAAIEEANILRSLVNSVFISICGTIVVIVSAAMVAFVVTRLRFKGSKYIALYFALGLMIPVYSTLIPLVKMVNRIGGSNSYPTLIIIYAAFNLPLAVLLLIGQMQKIDKSMDESAILDGCSTVRLFVNIIFPLSKPTISAIGIITYLYIYNDLLFGVMLISDASKYTVAVAMQSFVGAKVTSYGPIFASIIIAIIPMLIIYMLFQTQIEKGLAAGAIKG